MSSSPAAAPQSSHRDQWMAIALLTVAFGYPFTRAAAGGAEKPVLYAAIAAAAAGAVLAASALRARAFSWSRARAFALALFAFDLSLLHTGTRDGVDLILIAGAVFACLNLVETKDRIAVFFTLLIICGVGWFSGAGGGPDTFRRWVMSTFHLSQSNAETVVIAIRKTVHFSAYGVYGLSWRRLGWKMAIMQTLVLASFDEARQSTAGNRTGSPLDVLLDLSGAIVLLTLVHFATRKPSQQSLHE